MPFLTLFIFFYNITLIIYINNNYKKLKCIYLKDKEKIRISLSLKF